MEEGLFFSYSRFHGIRSHCCLPNCLKSCQVHRQVLSLFECDFFVLNQASKAEYVSLIFLQSHQLSAIKKLNSTEFYQSETWKKFLHLILEESFQWNEGKSTGVSFIPQIKLIHAQQAQHHCERKKEFLGWYCQPAQKKAMYQEEETEVTKMQ